MNLKKILFITHDSSRSGAPMLLLHLLRWLKMNKSSWIPDILTLNRGAMDDEFEKVAENYDYYYSKEMSTAEYYKHKFFKKKGTIGDYIENKFFDRYRKKIYDTTYANSVLSLPLATKIKLLYNIPPKLICNVHELPAVIDIKVKNFKTFVGEVDLFIAGSQLVCEALQNKYGVPFSKIVTLYDFTDLSKLPKYEVNKNPKMTIGGMGTVHWRKGHDLFLLTAIYMKRNYPTLHINFVWVGLKPEIEKIILDNDLEKSGLSEDYITFKNPSEDYYNFFTEFDIFFLSSREDPFPLVAIEACAYGLPLLTFEKATGINEVITENNGGGYILPYLDIQSAAEKIVYYYENREKLAADGEINKQAFGKFTVENAGVQFLKIIDTL